MLAGFVPCRQLPPAGDIYRGGNVQKRWLAVAWTDDIFGTPTPNEAKLAYLAKAVGAVYSGTVASAVSPAGSNARQLSAPPTLVSWAFDIEGQTIVLVEGTTSADQYALETDGYAHPTTFPAGGSVNGYYAAIGDAMFPNLPNNTAAIVGHSLGGAVASYLGWKFHAASLPLAGTLTFGAPRPFDSTAASAAVFPPAVNVAQIYDPVPLLPPDGVGGKNWKTPGDLYFLHPQGALDFATQPPSSVGDVWSVIQHYGFGSHDIGSYGDTLTVPAKVPFTLPLLGVSSMPEFYQCQVKGLLFGQACDNTFYYLPSLVDAADANNANLDFRTNWRQYILPRLSPEYSVLFYETRRISGVVQLLNTTVVPPVPYVPPRGNYRYDNFVRFSGIGTDVGSNVNADAFPSFNAVGASKACVGWADPTTTLPIPLTKAPRGRTSFGGIPRLSTQPTTDGNKLTVAELTSWQAACAQIVRPEQFGRRYLLCVVTHTGPGGGQLFNTANPPEPIYYYSVVSSLSPNPFITSQVSRKQTISGRG